MGDDDVIVDSVAGAYALDCLRHLAGERAEVNPQDYPLSPVHRNEVHRLLNLVIERSEQGEVKVFFPPTT